MPLVAAQTHFKGSGTQSHVTLGPHLHHVSWLAFPEEAIKGKGDVQSTLLALCV